MLFPLHSRLLRLLVLGILVIPAAAGMDAASAATSKSQAAEQNPPGDIPDTQVFVEYRSPLGFKMKVPEGWARADRSDGARFTDKYNTIDISVGEIAGAPKAAMSDPQVADLTASSRSVKVSAVKSVKAGGQQAVLIIYSAQSEPNAVTSKSIRLEANRYLFWKAGRLATLDLLAPAGADNVDDWKMMAQSFRWN
jgi:hypothetical protein